MAIIFVSPKKRQKTLFAVIAAATVFAFTVTAIVVFLPELREILKSAPLDAVVVKEPEIKINFSAMDSETIIYLEPFGGTGPRDFFYLAEDKIKKRVSGTVSADNAFAAMKALEKSGLKNITVTELEIGRNNPFAPY